MWDVVGNPEDRFSHNEAHFGAAQLRFVYISNEDEFNSSEYSTEIGSKNNR